MIRTDATEHDDRGGVAIVTENDGEIGPLKEEIMLATYRALATQGYSDLTVQAIADEFPKSKSLLYYHYDGKEDLLAGFLDFALDRFQREIELEASAPEAQLRALVDVLVPEELDDDRRQVQTALFELRGEAPYDERFRAQYTKVDRTVKETVAEILRRGVEEGVFVDLDPELEAETIVSLLFGIRTRRLTTYEEFPIAESRRALNVYVDRLLSESHDDSAEDAACDEDDPTGSSR